MTRPQKVVVDEIFPDHHIRICVSRMKSGAKVEDYLDPKSWEASRTEILSHSDLGGLLSRKQHNELREGKVFLIQEKRSKDVYDEFRQHIKGRVNALLTREGRTGKELSRVSSEREE